LAETFEKQARFSQVGLWADKNPTPPWEWGGMGKKIMATVVLNQV